MRYVVLQINLMYSVKSKWSETSRQALYSLILITCAIKSRILLYTDSELPNNNAGAGESCVENVEQLVLGQSKYLQFTVTSLLVAVTMPMSP